MPAWRPASLFVLALAGLAVAAGPADAKARRPKKAAPPPASTEQPVPRIEFVPGGALNLDLPMPLGDGPLRLERSILAGSTPEAPKASESLERWYRQSVTDKGARIVAAFSSGDVPQAGPGADALMTPFRTIAVVDGEIGDRERRLPTEKTVAIDTAIAVPLAPGIRLGIGLDANLAGSRPDFIPTLGIAHRF